MLLNCNMTATVATEWDRNGVFTLLSSIDLTYYSFLPNSLVSMLTYFSMSSTDKVLCQYSPTRNCFLLILDPMKKLYSVVLRKKRE